MTDPPGPLTRERLSQGEWTPLHRARSTWQADIHGVVVAGHRFAVKDYAQRPWIVRATVGRWSIGREAAIYRRLAGIRGVPAMHGVVEGPALVMEWLPHPRLPKEKALALTPEFFDALDRLLGEIHAAGVAHGDIRRKNIAIGDDGLPRLIDFGVATRRVPIWPLSRFFALVCASDRFALTRMRRSYFPDEPLTPEREAILAHPPPLLRLARWYRQRVYRPLKHRFRPRPGRRRRR